MPAGAAYGAAHVLDIADLELNAGALTATDDDALHVVAFMGDANRDQRFDTEDARLISRVGMGFDSGFEQYPTIDPMIIADLTGDGTISPLDCSHLMEEIVGLDSEYVPPMPVVENADPTADDQEVTTDEDTATIIQLTGDDGDPEVVQNLTFATTDPANGTLSGFDPATGTVTYTPAAGFNGTDTFTFTVTDDDQAGPTEDLTSPAATVTISVNPVNDRPTADPQSVSVPENGSEAIALTGDDGDSEVTQVLTYVITDQPDFGALTPPNQATGEVTYTPLGGYVGPDSFAFMVIDDNQAGSPPGLMSAEATVSITVVDVNDAPTFTASDPAAVDEDAGAQSVGGWATFDPGSPSESGQSVLQYTVSNVSNPALFAVAPSVGDDGTLTYTPADDAWGTSTFDVTVQDDGGTAHGGVDTSATQTFTITVGAVNDEPTLTASDPPAVGEDSGAQSVAGWPTFDPGSPSESSQSVLQYIVSNVSNAALFAVAPSVANDGTLTYTPADDAWGTSTFDVTVQDDGGTSNGGDDTSPPRTFTIVVNAVNDGPENHVPGLQTTPQNQTLVFSAASGNQIWITDPDAGSGVVEVSLTAEHGLLSLYSMMGTMAVVNAALDGLTFTPDPDYVGDASIEITTDDRGNIGSGGAVTDTDSIPITVESASPLVAAELPANVVSQVTGMAESYPSTPQTVGLTDDVLQPIVTEAVSRWVNAGLDGRVLEELRVTRTAITDLPGSELGLAAGPTIVIDQDAAGHGWFVDPTPSQDEEFSVAEGGELRAITPDAASTMDLLTVVEHELGHVTGLTDGPAGTADVMSATLPVGVRRVPSAADMTISSLESPEPALGAGLQAAPVPVETDFAPVAAAKWSFTGVENLMPQQSVNESVVSILETGSPLPANLDFGITFQTSGTREEWSSRWADALLIFDYKSPADYKFAGAFVGINTWAVGRMTERGYVLERTASEELDFGKDYRLQLHITGKSVCLAADGVEKLRFTFTDDLQSGDLGISTWKGSTRFDALAVEQV